MTNICILLIRGVILSYEVVKVEIISVIVLLPDYDTWVFNIYGPSKK